MKRDLGSMGESTFNLWCADAGLIANKSGNDKAGWDYIVEFPFKINSYVSADMQDSPLECKVQVKATQGSKKSISIKLSCLRRLVKSYLPAFIVIIIFGRNGSLKTAYLIHIDRKIIALTLKKIREFELVKDDTNFHRHKTSVRYDDNHRLKILNGECLKSTIEKHINPNFQRYMLDKQQFSGTVGFEDKSSTINITIRGRDNIESLLDCAVGIKKSIRNVDMQVFPKRFGIKNRNPEIDIRSGTLLLDTSNSYSKGYVQFNTGTSRENPSFEAKLFLSPFNSILPQNNQRLRIESEFFEIDSYFNKSEGEFLIKIDDSKKYPVQELRSFASFLNIITETDIFTLTLQFKGFPDICWGFQRNKLREDIQIFTNNVKYVLQLTDYFELPKSILTSVVDIYRYIYYVENLYSLVFNKVGRICVSFSTFCKEKLDINKKTTILFSYFSPLGENIVGCIFSAEGMPEINSEGKYFVASERINIEKTIVMETRLSIDTALLNRMFCEVEKRFDSNTQYVRIVDNEQATHHRINEQKQ